MSFQNIRDVNYCSVSSQYYFFDTNIWIYLLEKSGTTDIDYRFEPYIKFFNRILDSTISPKPKIIVTSLFFSEVINTYMKKVALVNFIYDKYGDSGKPEDFDYKRDFRSTQEYKNSYRYILDELKSYHEVWHPIDDKFVELKPAQILKKCPPNLDFNDFYYYNLCKSYSTNERPISIVTHDGDFKFEDIEIITALKSLKDLRTPIVMPRITK